MEEVRIWEEDVVIPTYEAGEPDKNPMFLESGFIRAVQERSILILLRRKSAGKKRIKFTMPYFWRTSI